MAQHCVTVTHPTARSYVHGASTKPGHAAHRAEQGKRAKYRRAGFQGYQFMPFGVETYGRLGRSAMKLLNRLSKVKTLKDASPEMFLATSMRELSVALCKGNALVFRKAAQLYVNLAGKDQWAGLRQPCADPDAKEQLDIDQV